MSPRSPSLASTLRICPVCSSDAVMASRIEDAGPAGLRCLVRCGGCETWRGGTLPAHEGFALEFRLDRRRRRHRRRLARELRRLERASVRAITVRDERVVTTPPSRDSA